MPDERERSKKPYAPPQLTEYGPVAKLTAAKSGKIRDGKSGMTMSEGQPGGGGMG